MAESEQYGSVPALTEPQTWTMIGAVIALMFGMLTIVSTLFIRILRAEISGLRGEVIGRFDAVDWKFESVNSRFDSVNSRFDAIDSRIDGLDRDVRALVKHTFGLDRG